MRYINTLHEGKRSEMYICVKESVRRRPETEDRMII